MPWRVESEREKSEFAEIKMTQISSYMRYWCANQSTRMGIEVEDLIAILEHVARRRRYMRESVQEVIERLEELKEELFRSVVTE